MEWNANYEMERIQEIENDSRLTISQKIVNPGPLVIEAKSGLSKHHEHSKWLLKNEGVVSKTGSLLIRVAPSNVDRALCLFDAIIKLFCSRGHRFEGLSVNVYGQNYEIFIRDKLKKLDDFSKESTNILCLKVCVGFPRFEIYDSKNVRIEDRISRAMVKVELEVENLKRIWADNTRREEKRKKKKE